MSKFIVIRSDDIKILTLAQAMGYMTQMTERFPTHQYTLAEVEGNYEREIGPLVKIKESESSNEILTK